MAHKLLVQVVDDSPPAQSRFSTLPVELKFKILDFFSFEDAARTGILSSILSSTSNWSEHPQVILDKTLFEERNRWIAPHAAEWANRVAKILLSNRREGLIPIRKFILHIPDMQFGWELQINNWIAFLSWNGIKELSLDNWNVITYKLSSFLFECPELTRLMLRNCAFRKSFGSFQNLRFLRLEKIAFGSDQVGTVNLDAPLLMFLELSYCVGFKYLNVHAPNLKVVSAVNEYDAILDDKDEFSLRVRNRGCSVSWLFCG